MALLPIEYGISKFSLRDYPERMASDVIAEYRRVIEATQPGKVDALSLSEMQKYYDFLCSYVALAKHSGPNTLDQWSRRIEELRHAMQHKRHQESVGLGTETLNVGNQTLCWTKVAAVAAILAVVATVILGIVQIWLSNTGTSKPDQASPASLPQMTATISESPAPAVSSNSAKPSPQPPAETKPSVLPR